MKNLLLPIAVIFVIGISTLNAQITWWNPIIPDFQVNDNRGIVNANQREPDIAMTNSGKAVIIWIDGREGTDAIYAQLIAENGELIGQNKKLIEFPDSAFIERPSVAMDSCGNFVVTWHEFYNGGIEYIYAQRYLADGTQSGNKIQVNEWSHEIYFPDVASDKEGNFMITWESTGMYSLDIFAQLYSKDGIPIDSNFRVSEDTMYNPQEWPSISSDNDGNFVIAWLGSLDNIRGIYAQRFSNNGTRLGGNVKVNDHHSGSPLFGATDVSNNTQGEFVIIWEGMIGSKQHLFGQRFANDGTKIGQNFQFDSDSISVSFYSRDMVSMDSVGNLIVVWNRFIPSTTDYDIYAQKFSCDGNPIGNNFRVNDDSTQSLQGFPEVIVDFLGNSTIVWEDSRTWDWDIFIQRYDSSGLHLGTNLKINDDTLSTADQHSPSIAVNVDSSFVITWEDKRNGHPDIYAQRFTCSGIPIDTNFKVNEDTAQEDQSNPKIANDSYGDFIIAWIDGYPSVVNNIYAQRYSPDGIPLGANFKINEVSGNIGPPNSALSVAMDSSGNSVFTWNQTLNSSLTKVYGQRYSKDGLPLGNNFLVSPGLSQILQMSSEVSIFRNGNFIITWTDTRNGFFEIYAQRYSHDGIPIGDNFKVNEDSTGVMHAFPAIATDKNGNFVVSWYLFGNSMQSANVYARRYSTNGVPYGKSFRVSEGSFAIDSEQHRPSVSYDIIGNFIISWENRFENGDIYAQRFSSDGTKIGNNFLLTSNLSGVQHSPDVKLWNNRIYSTWEDNRAGNTGFDIWTNVLDFSNPVGVDERTTPKIPRFFRLEANFPNPFNPSTTISYRIPGKSIVDITIFNVLGQKVKSLVHRRQLPGYYRVKWDGTDDSGKPVASGIYLYQLKTKTFVKTRKMILLR